MRLDRALEDGEALDRIQLPERCPPLGEVVAAPDVVDQDVEPPGLLLDAGEELLDLIGLQVIGLDRNAPAARGGQFYAPRCVNFGAPVRRPILRRVGLDKSIATLWSVSERETGVRLDVGDALAAAGR